MARVVYIEASPRKERSASIAVSKVFFKEYQKIHPEDEIYTIDLWERDLPEFDGDTINAKYAIIHQKQATAEEKRAWSRVEELIEEFKAADKVIISTPMWNYLIPYKLKHYIDILVQPGYAFSFHPDKGYTGLITGRPAAVIYARGGAYPPGTDGEKSDFQKPYTETVLRFMGFTDIHPIIVEPTLGNKEQALREGKEQAIKVARSF